MKKLLVIVGVLSFCFAQNEAKLVPLIDSKPTVQTSIDNTQNIVVSGSSSAVRSRVLNIAMNERQELYQLLGLKEDSQKLKINIGLYGEEGDPIPPVLIKKGFALAQGSISLSLDVHLAHGVNENRLEQAVIELLLYELGLQDYTFGPDEPLKLKLKPWIAQGVRETIQWKSDRTDRALYARLFEQQSIYPLDELMNEERFDDSLEVLDVAFQVSSGALVMALVNQPQGEQGLLDFVKEAITYEGEQKSLLTKHFPNSTLSKNSLAKWWALQLASMSQNPAENLLTIEHSEEELKQALILKMNDAEGVLQNLPPERYHEIPTFPENTQKLSVTLMYNRLSILQSRSFPSYRPIISGYQAVLMELIGESTLQKKKSFWSLFSFKKSDEIDTDVMLATLAEERQILAKLGQRTTDYLNWYQLERPETQGENFADFLEVKQGLENTTPSDGGHISRYLNDVEAMYER